MNERNKIEGVKEKRGKRTGPAGEKEKRGDNRRHGKVKEDKWRAQLTTNQVMVIKSDDTEDTKKAIEPPGDDGRYDPATAGTRRRSPIRSVVTRLGRNPMTSTTTTPDSSKDVEWSKKKEKEEKD